MIEQTKQLVESKYTISNGYQGDAKVRNTFSCARSDPNAFELSAFFISGNALNNTL